MYKLLTQRGQMFALLLGIILIVLFLGSIFSGLSSAGYSASDDLNAIMKGNPEATFNYFNPAALIFFLLPLVCAGLWLVFSLFQLISSPKESIKFIIALVVLIAAFFLLYSTSVHETSGGLASVLQKFDVGESASKFISAGIKSMGLLLLVAVASIIVCEIRNAFK